MKIALEPTAGSHDLPGLFLDEDGDVLLVTREFTGDPGYYHAVILQSLKYPIDCPYYYPLQKSRLPSLTPWLGKITIMSV